MDYVWITCSRYQHVGSDGQVPIVTPSLHQSLSTSRRSHRTGGVYEDEPRKCSHLATERNLSSGYAMYLSAPSVDGFSRVPYADQLSSYAMCVGNFVSINMLQSSLPTFGILMQMAPCPSVTLARGQRHLHPILLPQTRRIPAPTHPPGKD